MAYELPIIDAEIVEPPTPEQVEAAMLREEQVKAEQADPSEIASMMLTLYTPRFCSLVDQLSNRQLKRLTKSLVEYPLGKTYAHNDKVEAEAFHLGKNLLDAKMVLIYDTYSSRQEEIIAKANEAANGEEEKSKSE